MGRWGKGVLRWGSIGKGWRVGLVSSLEAWGLDMSMACGVAERECKTIVYVKTWECVNEEDKVCKHVDSIRSNPPIAPEETHIDQATS